VEDVVQVCTEDCHPHSIKWEFPIVHVRGGNCEKYACETERQHFSNEPMQGKEGEASPCGENTGTDDPLGRNFSD
jgi:hypothetical protein